jgi:hypothetical protein
MSVFEAFQRDNNIGSYKYDSRYIWVLHKYVL